MGFFDLMEVSSGPLESTFDDVRFIKFKTGSSADGPAADGFRAKDLEPLVGDIPSKHSLYAAITEAMTNVVHHAYERQPDCPCPNWWLSASWDATNQQLDILIFDQGHGIPETLPRKNFENPNPIPAEKPLERPFKPHRSRAPTDKVGHWRGASGTWLKERCERLF